MDAPTMTSMSIASKTCTATTAGRGKMASTRFTERKDLRGHVLDRHQNLPFLSVALATNMLGGQIMTASNSLESSRMATLSLRHLSGQNLALTTVSLVATNFCHTLRSGTPPPTSFGQNFNATSTMTACMKKMKKTQPPCAAENSAMVVILALSSRNRNTVLAAISER